MTDLLEEHDGFHQSTIPARYLLDMLAGLDAAQRAAALAAAGLGDDTIEPADRFSGAQFQRMHAQVVRTLDDEVYGAFRRPVPRGTYAAFLRLCTGYRTLDPVFMAADAIYGLFDGASPWIRTRDGDAITITLRTRPPHQQASILFGHAMLLTLWRTAGWLARTALPLDAVLIDRRFADFAREGAFLFGLAPTLVDGPCGLRFPASVLDLPVRRTPDDCARWARQSSFADLIGRPPRSDIEARVRAALAGEPDARAADVARALGVSTPTLARRLRARGTTFRAVRDGLRRDRAINMLAAGHTVEETALALGFSEPSAFHRAFRRWTGSAPGRYRRGTGSTRR